MTSSTYSIRISFFCIESYNKLKFNIFISRDRGNAPSANGGRSIPTLEELCTELIVYTKIAALVFSALIKPFCPPFNSVYMLPSLQPTSEDIQQHREHALARDAKKWKILDLAHSSAAFKSETFCASITQGTMHHTQKKPYAWILLK